MAVVPFATQVRGQKSGRAVLAEEANRIAAARLVRVYESHELTIPTPLLTPTSLNAVVNHATSCTCGRASTAGAVAAFSLLPRAERLLLRNVGAGQILFRLSDLLNDVFSLDSGEIADFSMIEFDDLLFQNASGVAVAVKVTLA